MATNYTAVSSYATVKVYSPSQVLDIQMVGFYTIPSNVFCEYGVPHAAFVEAGSNADNQPLLESLASYIEDAARGNGVVGGTFVQDVDPATGLLTDYVQYDLAYSSPVSGRGPFTTFVNVAVNSFFAANPGIGGLIIDTSQFPSPMTLVTEAYDALVATAGG